MICYRNLSVNTHSLISTRLPGVYIRHVSSMSEIIFTIISSGCVNQSTIEFDVLVWHALDSQIEALEDNEIWSEQVSGVHKPDLAVSSFVRLSVLII